MRHGFPKVKAKASRKALTHLAMAQWSSAANWLSGYKMKETGVFLDPPEVDKPTVTVTCYLCATPGIRKIVSRKPGSLGRMGNQLVTIRPLVVQWGLMKCSFAHLRKGVLHRVFLDFHIYIYIYRLAAKHKLTSSEASSQIWPGKVAETLASFHQKLTRAWAKVLCLCRWAKVLWRWAKDPWWVKGPCQWVKDPCQWVKDRPSKGSAWTGFPSWQFSLGCHRSVLLNLLQEDLLLDLEVQGTKPGCVPFGKKANVPEKPATLHMEMKSWRVEVKEVRSSGSLSFLVQPPKISFGETHGTWDGILITIRNLWRCLRIGEPPKAAANPHECTLGLLFLSDTRTVGFTWILWWSQICKIFRVKLISHSGHYRTPAFVKKIRHSSTV